MGFTKQTYPDLRIDPINGRGQCITNPSNIPTSKEVMELYYQHRVLTDGIQGKINFTMTCTVRNHVTPFCKYLSQDKVYVSDAVLGLVDTHNIGIMLQMDPNSRSEMTSRHLSHIL
jgi:hypothetical protein